MWEVEPVTLRPSDGEVLAVSGLVGHCRGLALRHCGSYWRHSSSTAARKIAEGNDYVFLPTTYKPLAYCINESEMCNSCNFGSSDMKLFSVMNLF